MVSSRLRQRLLNEFTLGKYSVHGREHWERVERYGLYVARYSGADAGIVSLFAWFHDSRRHNEGHDPEHGPRAAALSAELCGVLFDLEPARLALLIAACEGHDRGKTSPDPTVGTCWDADRLDLDRVGIKPRAHFFSTEMGRHLAEKSSAERRKLAGSR